MRKKVLLTGAGFTHNFGTPLASQLRNIVFNKPTIQNENDLRNLLLPNQSKKSNDLEYVYGRVLNEKKTDRYKEGTRRALVEAISEAYKTMDDHIVNITRYDDKLRVLLQTQKQYGINLLEIVKFIMSFSTRHFGTGFIFTLNQDLFLERLLKLYFKMLASPAIGSCVYDYPREQNSQDGIIPNAEKLNKWKAKYSLIDITDKREIPWYIKLHGSYLWRNPDDPNKLPYVIGTNKSTDIANEPILNWYFEIFKDVLLNQEVDLLIIGYSFRDDHINKIIKEAIEEKNLRLHILSPFSLEQFSTYLSGVLDKSSQIFINSIFGYYEGTLKEIFGYASHEFEEAYFMLHTVKNLDEKFRTPTIHSETTLAKQLKENFFEGKM